MPPPADPTLNRRALLVGTASGATLLPLGRSAEAQPERQPPDPRQPVLGPLDINGQRTGSRSTPAPRCSMRCASTWASPAPRRAATTASAAPAPCCRRRAGALLPDARGAWCDGHAVTTIEGLAEPGRRRCIRCSRPSSTRTPSSAATARRARSCRRSPASSEGHAGQRAEIREYMSGNLCRCAAYPNIVAAIEQAAPTDAEGLSHAPLRLSPRRRRAAEAVRRGRGPAAPPTHPRQFIAGGTTLLDLMKLDVMRPERLVDINALRRRSARSRSAASGLRARRAGAHGEVADHPADPARLSGDRRVAAARRQPQLRNMASLGGNVLQRTRCAYFRDPSWPPATSASRARGCAALDGVNRKHAVLGVSEHCIAIYPGDFAQALVALDARSTSRARAATRTHPVRGRCTARPATRRISRRRWSPAS